MRAAQHIINSLKAHGINRVYCVPGESYLTLLDALHESGIEVIVCRQEGGAGFMACAEAKMTGKPAVFMVSRGPGATNASIAIHMAEQDALPVLLLVGQVSRDELTRAVFQEVDYSHFFGKMAKGVFEPQDGAKLHEFMPRALRLACEGVAGPVVISLPEDVLGDDVPALEPVSPYPIPKPAHSIEDISLLQRMLDEAERPLLVAGALFRAPEAAEVLARFANALRIPVATTWKNQDVFDNNSPLYAGQMGFGTSNAMKSLLGEADLIIAAGTRMGDVASLGFTVPAAPQPSQRFVHIYPDPRPIGKVTRPDLAMLADPISVLASLATKPKVAKSSRENWNARIRDFIAGFSAFTSIHPDDGVDFGAVTMALAKHAPANAVITMDAGNMTTWAHRHWKMTPANTLLGGIVGAMGLGVPAAVAASIVDPSRMAICFVGDGGVLMNGQELATAMAYGARPKIVISDNGIYGTIRTHQEREFPGRVSGTMLVNPDFAAWARSFGAEAFVISSVEHIQEQVSAFLAAPGAAVLHVKSSRKALSANGQLNSAATEQR